MRKIFLQPFSAGNTIETPGYAAKRTNMYEKLPEALALAGRLIDESAPKNNSLFSGKAGTLYYYYNAWRLTGRDAYLQNINRFAGELADEIFLQQPADISFANGISGICSVLHLLHEQKLLRHLPREAVQTDEYLYTRCMEEPQSGGFSFTNGIAGVAGYFCKRAGSPLMRKYLEDIRQKLLDTGLGEETATEINFTLWQGLCGKLALLFRLLNIFPANVQIRLRLAHYLHILRSYILQIDAGQNHFSFFPVATDEKTGLVQAPNCLFWEAGDLPVVHLLYKAYDVFGDNDFKKLAGVAGAYTLTRRSFEETLIKDPCFSGGACGTALMYRSLEKTSGVSNYHKGYAYWLNQSVLLFSEQIKNNAFEHREHQFTAGLTGMALSWLDHLYSDAQSWTELFIP